MPYPKGHPRAPGSGRKKGTPNKLTVAFNTALQTLLDEPETLEALRRLRDSEEAMDRSTFWKVAARKVPNVVEAKVESVVRARIIDLSSDRGDEDVDHEE